MKGKEKLNLAICELNQNGYNSEKIAKRLGISVSSVYRALKKQRQQSNQWLTNLAQKDLANTFKQSLDGSLQDLMHLNDLLEDESVKENVKLQLQIRREIIHARSEYFKNLLQGPMVWSMQSFIKENSPHSIIEPKMDALGGISGVN